MREINVLHLGLSGVPGIAKAERVSQLTALLFGSGLNAAIEAPDWCQDPDHPTPDELDEVEQMTNSSTYAAILVSHTLHGSGHVVNRLPVGLRERIAVQCNGVHPELLRQFYKRTQVRHFCPDAQDEVEEIGAIIRG